MTRERHQIGTHHVEIDGDVVVSRWFGPCTLGDLETFLPLFELHMTRVRHPFLLIDNTHVIPAGPEVRRRVFEWTHTHEIDGGVVMFGAPPGSRIIGTLVLHALSILKGAQVRKRAIILSDEASAYAWIARRRAELAAVDAAVDKDAGAESVR